MRSMAPPGHPAAQAAAATVQAHFAQHVQNARAAAPDVETIQAIVDAAFWASLRREEGISPKISIALVAPDQVNGALRFERPFILAAHSLTRVSPAVERPGIHLGVWRSDGQYWVWGATRRLPPYSFVLEVVAPGVLVIKHTRGVESGKFVNVAVIEGDQVKVIDQHAVTLPECPALLLTLLGLESQFTSDSASVLIQLAVSMREHGRGGSLLVVPANSEHWRESILKPITYPVAAPFAGDWMPQDGPGSTEALRRAVEALAGLTAVDGATIITDRYELMAFGAKIVRRPGSVLVSQVMVTQPIEGATAEIVEPALLGGTRHLSAAQFVYDQHDALAMVASQDGRFTVFAWSPCEDMVHAHGIEALLL